MGFSEQLLKRTRKLLSSKTKDVNVSDEQARESLHNIAGFLGVLLDWHRADSKHRRAHGEGTEKHPAKDQGDKDES
jgi:hypothetical protein